MNYGLELKLERIRLGLNQREACRRLGITIHTLIDIERGRLRLTKAEYERFAQMLQNPKPLGASSAA